LSTYVDDMLGEMFAEDLDFDFKSSRRQAADDDDDE
jgi:hypothetical protein